PWLDVLLSLLAVDVEADLLLAVGYGHVALGRSDDDGLAGRRRTELLRQIHGDGQDVTQYGHLHVLHRVSSSGQPSPKFATRGRRSRDSLDMDAAGQAEEASESIIPDCGRIAVALPEPSRIRMEDRR